MVLGRKGFAPYAPNPLKLQLRPPAISRAAANIFGIRYAAFILRPSLAPMPRAQSIATNWAIAA